MEATTTITPEATDQAGAATEPNKVHAPIAFPAEQAYYWTSRWQEAEEEALAEIAVGDFETFDSNDPDDIVRWLRDDE